MKSHHIFVFFSILAEVYCGNILFLSPVPSPSHHIYNRVLAVGLAEKGHNVTFLSADLDKRPVPNLHYLHLEGTYKVMESFNVNLIEFTNLNPTEYLFASANYYEFICSGNLASKSLDHLLNYPKDFKFDAVIYDFTFGPCMIPFLARFNYPVLISVTAFGNPPYTTDIVGGQKYPAYIPHYMHSHPNRMNFMDRVYNHYLYFVDWLSRNYWGTPAIEKLVREKFLFEFPPLDELQKKSALILINSDDAFEYAEPMQPNMIQVGGLQITPAKPLSKELDDFIKKGKKGTILMSLGTNIKSNMLGDERLKVVLQTFAQIPDYNFLWKFESDVKDLPIQPSSNVMVNKFLPQNDILAHPHIKAFISHSGMLSTYEALYHGKPIIAIPFFVDQMRNAAKSCRLGVAMQLDFNEFTMENFKSNIMTVLDDKKYSEKSAYLSKLLKDKPKKPLDVAIWWIEYAIRNPNLDHLKSPTLHLGPIISKSYDVILFIAALVHLFVFVLIKLSKLCKKSSTKKAKRE